MKSILIWTVSIILTLAAMVYQRSTGPTYAYKGHLEHSGKKYRFELIRSQETTREAEIELPFVEAKQFEATLFYKRYQTEDTLTKVNFQLDDNKRFTARLPLQPAAGKMEYFISGIIEDETFNIPEQAENSIVLRYKDPVSGYILFPHILMMIIAITFGIRAGLSTLFDPGATRRLTLIAFSAMTVGGMVLGPLVQKSAFGSYWTGFPLGGDFTDNKTLIMWLAWALALMIVHLKTIKTQGVKRGAVLFASVVMIVVYLIPHSMGGSTLDYDKLDRGVDPKEAIKTGAP